MHVISASNVVQLVLKSKYNNVIDFGMPKTLNLSLRK